jgi:hypothetical protein
MVSVENEKALEGRARRAAQKVGLRAMKSRARYTLNNRGGFMICDPYRNWVVAGDNYSLTPQAVIEYCDGIGR